MKFKKIFARLVILAALGTGLFAKTDSKKNIKNSGRIKIVATIFPEYDWTREILGDKISETELYLLSNGVDLHSYQPSIQDIAKISTAEILIYVGGESDGWVKNALKNATNKNMKVINLMETLGDSVRKEEFKEGMQTEAAAHNHREEHNGDEKHDKDDDHNGDHCFDVYDDKETEYDEHVWLSLRNAKIICQEISTALCQKDPENADIYKKNLNTYTARLNALDEKYSATVKASSKKTILFGDRFPFRYLVDDYGLDYFAAFVGCSAETEASFETIIFLSKKVDELDLNTVFKIETGDGKIARTVIQSSTKKNAEILTLDSMQSVTLKQAKAGTSYISIMEKNLSVLKEALK